MAARLAERGHDVTLIEAGAEPGEVFPGPFARGRGLGGSSAVNGMLATPGDLGQYVRWGWPDAAEALGRVRMPVEVAADDELGPLDRALLASAPDATKAPLTRRGGRRVTAADAYLPGTAVTVLAGAEVARVRLAGRRAVGVELADGRTVAADAVVVSAGAIGSPILLAASGVDVPGIGQGLQNHPGLPISVRLRDRGATRSGVVGFTLLRRGDLQLVPLGDVLLVMVMAPTGTGEVRGSPAGAVVDHVLDDHDHERLAAGLALARDVLDHPAMRAVVEDIDVGTAPDLVYHPTSTCRMGVVVDDDGAVIGYDGLYVADASVFPTIPHTNTYLPTLMLAERLAARARFCPSDIARSGDI
jgi:choline dehydrogenase-like flavoprotein